MSLRFADVRWAWTGFWNLHYGQLEMGNQVGVGSARSEIGGEPSLRVFGDPTLNTENGPVVVAGHSGRLLAALAARRRGMTIDELIEVLWPAHHPKTARSALHVHLGRLRRLLEEVGSPADEIRVVRHGERYTLDTGRAVVDTQLFESLRRRAGPLVRLDPAEAAELMAQALDVASAPAFVVGGESVDPSATSQIALARLDLEEQFVDALIGAGHLQEAERNALDLVVREPFRENRWVSLMRAQAKQGHRADALATFRRARIALVNGLGLEPGDDLQRTQRAVLANDVDALEVRLAEDEVEGELPPASSGPLVGRAVELDRAERALASTSTLVLLGAPGVGKTRLAAELAFRAAEAVDVTWVDLRGAQFADETAVDQAVRWVRRHPGGLIVFDNAEADRRLAAELVRAVRRVAPRVAVVVTSRAPIEVESAAMMLRPLAVSIPERGSDAAADPAGRTGAFADASRTGGGEQAQGGGERGDAEQQDGEDGQPAAVVLLRSLLAVRAPEAEVSEQTQVELVRLVGGLPLGLRLVADLAHMVSPEELVARAGNLVVDELGPSVHALLDQLGGDACRAMAALSVVPGRLDSAAVEALTGHDVGSRTIGALHDAGLLHYDAASPDAPYSLLEPIRDVAAAILDELGDRTEVLDRLTEDCLRRSKELSKPTVGHSLSEIAARLEHDLPLHRQAMAHLAAHGRAEPALKLAVNLELGLYLIGRWKVATELQSAALAIDGPPSRRRALVHVMRGRPGPLHLMDAAHQEVARAMAEQVGDPATVARAMCYLGLRAWWDGDHPLALQRLHEAKRWADESGSPFAETDVGRFVGVVLLSAGEVDRGLAMQRSALARAETEDGLRAFVPHVRMYLGHSRRSIGDVDAAIVNLEAARSEFEDASNVASLIHVNAGLAELAADRGDAAGARNLSLRGLELAVMGARFEYDGWLACTLARACVADGDEAGARAAAAEAVAGVRRGWVGETHRVAAELASIAQALGDAPAAARLIGLADATPDRRELPFVTPAERERVESARRWVDGRLGRWAQHEYELGAGSMLAEAAARLVSA